MPFDKLLKMTLQATQQLGAPRDGYDERPAPRRPTKKRRKAKKKRVTR